MSQKIRLSFQGKTTDGKLVLKDVFKLRETYGFPLQVVAQAIKEAGLMVPWLDLVADMRKHGLAESSIRSEVRDMAEIIFDTPEHVDVVMTRLGFNKE